MAAPITLVTALLIYVGWTRNRAYYGFFGLNQGILSPSVQDYVLRSADVTFGAVTRLVVAALVFVALDRVLFYIIRKHATSTKVNWINASLAVVGLIFSVAGLLLALELTGGLQVSPVLAAGILGGGAVLVLRFGPAALPRSADIQLIVRLNNLMLYTILTLALFWAATLYAQDLGQRAARTTDANPSALPLVTIFSTNYLDLPGSQVEVTQVADPGGTQHYRYTGLSLVTYSNGRWFLITGRYSNGYRSSVVVLVDSDSIRAEIAAS